MQGIMATLADKEQALLRAIVETGMPTHGASLAGVVRIDFHCHTPYTHRFVGNIAMQLGKGPLRGMSVCSALFPACLLALRAPGALTDMGQVFQADDAVWVLVHNAPTDLMIGGLVQPSLPSANDHQSPGSRTGAFVLQPLSQSCIVVRFGPDLFTGIEGGAIGQWRCDCQVALSYIHANDMLMRFWGGICYFHLKGDEQIELLAWLIIPEFCRPDLRTVLHESKMLIIARIGDHHAPTKGEDAHLVLGLQAVVPVVVIGQRWGNIRGWLIESLVALPGDACLAGCSVLLDLGPERLVGSSHLARDVTGHLGRQMIGGTYVCIRLSLQPLLVTLLAMGKRVARGIVQGITIRQLRGTQCHKLNRIGMQFQCGGHLLPHRTSVRYFT